MDEFLRYVVQQLAACPDEATISHHRVEGRINSTLSLNADDVGRLIGKGGSTITAIRNLILASAEKQGSKATLEIVGI